MNHVCKLVALGVLATSSVRADPVLVDTSTGTLLLDDKEAIIPPSAVTPRIPAQQRVRHDPLATTERWGGGARVTGLSGIGALPGVNYGGELAVLVRHDEMFGELGLGWWRPEKPHVVAETPQHIELGLQVWTLRAGWASMRTPIRAWGLYEVGELASPTRMPGAVPRMVMGDVPAGHRWQALGGGLGVAWPMSDNARLIGMVEFAVPVSRGNVMLTTGAFEPDPMVARASAGLELGWR